MNKKIIIIIIFLLLITTGILFTIKNKENKIPDIAEVPSRNDTAIIPESISTSTINKTYSITEVSVHDKKTDCWMIIGDKVIDATSFIASGGHPNNKIINGCGKDATEMFKSVKKHGGPEAQEVMMKSQIGVLE